MATPSSPSSRSAAARGAADSAEPRRPRRPTRRVVKQPGAAPGTILPRSGGPGLRLRALAYGPDDLHEREIQSLDELDALRGERPVLWLDVEGAGDEPFLRALGARFGLHPLALEDVASLNQRPKLEDYGDHLFLLARLPRAEGEVRHEQVSLFVGSGFVLSLQERSGDWTEPVRQRLRAGRGRIRQAGADYLAYALLDTVVDHAFPVLETLNERMDELEERVLAAQPPPGLVAKLTGLRRDVVELRRSIWPLRDVLNLLLVDPGPTFSEETRVFLRDCHDHVLRIIDWLETLREQGSGLMEVHLSMVSQRMNEVMKLLTIISTLFIPLGFIAGLYGMNFDRTASPWNMPELGWAFGYPLALGIMATVVLGLLVYFWRKGWLGGGGA